MVGGKVVTNCDCCGGGPVGPCPDSINFTISGLVVGCGCMQTGPSSSMTIEEWTGTVNGTFSAALNSTDEAGNCRYDENHDLAVRLHLFNDINCTVPASTSIQPVFWEIVRINGAWFADENGQTLFHGGPDHTPGITIGNVFICGAIGQNVCDDYIASPWGFGTPCATFNPRGQGGTVVVT